jgi:hypothetical protein
MLKIFYEGECGRKENSGGDEPNEDTRYVHMEMSQQKSLYSYHILIKCFTRI